MTKTFDTNDIFDRNRNNNIGTISMMIRKRRRRDFFDLGTPPWTLLSNDIVGHQFNHICSSGDKEFDQQNQNNKMARPFRQSKLYSTSKSTTSRSSCSSSSLSSFWSWPSKTTTTCLVGPSHHHHCHYILQMFFILYFIVLHCCLSRTMIIATGIATNTIDLTTASSVSVSASSPSSSSSVVSSSSSGPATLTTTTGSVVQSNSSLSSSSSTSSGPSPSPSSISKSNDLNSGTIVASKSSQLMHQPTSSGLSIVGKSYSQIVSVYRTGNHSMNFTHLAIDHLGTIYAGGSNLLYQLNSSLALVERVSTGPIRDSPYCSPSDCSGIDEQQSIQWRNNINKVLVVDEHSNSLLVCGTVHQGACRKHRLGAIVQSDELIPLPVAANDENSSTLAFVGPSRYNGNHQITPVLYVAVTDSRLGPYRDMVPAISSRSLEPGQRYLSIIEKSFTDTAKIDIQSNMKDYFLVNYVYGFTTPDFVYFATVQKRSHLRALEEWGYHSRLARVCQSDPAYNTYTEVTIECIGPDGRQYSLLQDATLIEAGDELARTLRVKSRSKLFVGAFARAIEHTSMADTESAICIYTLQEIEQKFAQNIHMCYNGSISTRNMDYIAGNIPNCPQKRISNIVSFCSETLKINGSLPIVRRSALTFIGHTLTAILGQVTPSGYNVLFAGTNDGLLKKILISGPDLAEEFDQVIIDRDGHRILSDMVIDPSGKYLYCASPYVIAKVTIEHCPFYNNCRSCLNSRNPYCGWCSLQKSCTLRGHCMDPRQSVSSRWLSVDSSKCIEFQSIFPEFLPINSLDKVKLIINQLPRLPLNVSYQCVFGHNEPIQAEPMHNGLICQSPPVSLRPKLSDGQDYVAVDLAIRPSDTRTDFLQRKFLFYDCNFYKTCSGCVQSRWSCQWCFKENRCVSSGYLCGTLSLNYTVPKYMIGGQSNYVIRHRNECPSFNFTMMKNNNNLDIILPNGVAREISLPVQNLAFGNVLFGCLIQIEGLQTYVSARIINGHIVCATSKFSYENESATSVATVTAVWNKVNFIDRINITLYKCLYLGSHNERSDCSICLNLNPMYDCVWCGNQCSHIEQCDEQRAMICPPPRIDLIHPLSGPIQGGTIITVEGSNLGVNADEIRDKVLIGGHPCVVQNFTISVEFTCITQPVHNQLWADVVVGNRAGFTTARDKFLYAMPEVFSASPNTGPQSGGTRIYISGNNLSIGTSLEVYLDEYPCIVDRMLVSSTQISCRTTAAKYPNYEVDKLYIKIDNATLVLSSDYRYVPDPTILRIYPLKSYVSGGRSVTVIGTNFDVIQQPRLAIFNIDGTFINDTVCEVQSSSQMICPSPPVNSELIDIIYQEQMDSAQSSLRTAPASSPSFMANNMNMNDHNSQLYEKISFRIGFIMDWVMSVRDLSVNYSTIHSDLIYVPDPKAFPFEEGIKDYKGDSLVIEGENLRLATSESEINVTIGNKPCNLTSLAANQIVCIPPEQQPEPTDELGRRTAIYLPLVVVRVGNTLRYEIGYLRYDSGKGYELSLLTIAFIIIFSLILVVFVLVSFVFMRHKSLLAEREYKRIQMQMDTLENSVRSECKQAFAELQTDMTDLTNDLENCGVPILEHRNYVMKVFFPGVDDHPLFQPARRSQNGSAYNIYELAMAQFEQLIYNKSFLICFLNTLEKSPSFNIRDRVNVASLLMVILMERMEYATDILRTLLLQLVEKSVNCKYPQLMLRRTESVVEKMLTNWLALTMYDYMKNYAGSQLFMLFSAIKHQIEKGPIDVITHDARYSLSEERLLREHYSQYEQLILQVFQPEKPLEKYHVRVNDCDTINQVKGKILDVILKNTPFSMRPSIHEFDLEWRDALGNHLLLQDVDVSSKREHHGTCWQRLNTLKHYNVKNMALVMLITKNHANGLSSSHTMTVRPSTLLHQHHRLYHTQKKSTTGSSSSSSIVYPLLSSPTPTIANHCLNGFVTDVDNDHFWHLVKPSFDDTSKESSSSSSGSALMHKAIPEIFLTRLLSTKGTIQKFIDDFFHTILVVNDSLPVSIKWIFDLLDEAAIMYNIMDPDVVHAWKSNCLPLRFWVNFIKNPNFIVDVNKTPTIDSNLSVIAQTLMDSCSSSDHRLGKDSPSSKLLFAKDIVNYRKLVMQFYQDVYHATPVNEQTLFSHMQNLNMTHQGEFDIVCALKELFVYAVKYHQEIIHNLQNHSDYHAKQQSLEKFINLINYKF